MNKFKKVLNELKKHKNFLIISHINPEGDSIGSQLAFLYLLKAMNKNAYIVNSHMPPDKYRFLPKTNKILTAIKQNVKYDAICFLDCATEERIGNIYGSLDLSKRKINIDHHTSNTKFGDVNFIDAKASSAAEILYSLFKAAKININKDIATCLYAGILTDTGCLRYSNVTPFTHKVIADLVKIGVNPEKIYKNIYEETRFASLKLLGCSLSTLKLSPNKKIAYMHITQKMLDSCKTSLRNIEDFINFPRSIKGVEVALLFSEICTGIVKIGFRSNSAVDVNRIASYFGGGGHKKASGCIVKGSLAKAEKQVLAIVKKYVK